MVLMLTLLDKMQWWNDSADMIKHNEHKNNFKSKIDIVVDLIYQDDMIKKFEIVFF